MTKKSFFLLLLICSSNFLNAQKVFEFSSTCQQAYKEIGQLKMASGKALLEKAKLQNPNNLIPIYLESFVDVLELFFNENSAEYKLRKSNISNRINLLKKGSETSPFYRYCLSNLYLHKALIGIRYGESISAALDSKKAYSLIKENRKLFSTFSPNEMLYGSLQTITGTIPNGYKWLASIMGMKGSVTEGMKLLSNFTNSNDPWAKLFATESELLFCYLNYYVANKKDETMQRLQTNKFDLINNHLFAYIASNLAINNKQTELGKSIILNRNKSSVYMTTPVWDLQMGYTNMHKLELQDAINAFEKYLNTSKGSFYLKDVYQKLSWAYYLQNNLAAAQSARTNVLTKGSTEAEADKQALKEAKDNKWANVILLKSRLLNDGGYNDEALKLLAEKNIESFIKQEEKLEFIYRLGRIYDDMNKTDDAIKLYKQTIEMGKNRTEYYAARAALQIAMIYEKSGNKIEAIKFYNTCIDMDDHDYKNSLDLRAKSGVARCKND